MSSPHQTSPKNVTEKEQTAPPETVKGRKMMNVKVIFLDDSNHTFQIQGKTSGRVLFDKVCKFLNLFEVDYFGLEYEDERSTKYWLDCLKPMCRQVGLTNSSPTMHFCVKFYTPDPVQLEDEFTRYLLSLQLKKDLASGVLQCNDNTAALMISYIVQADCGDYDLEEFPEHSYLSSYKFVPYQDANLERKIMENHKKHMSQTPAEADLNLLETARRCELYGIKMTAAKDHEGVPLNLAVAHVGVLVFQNYTKINTFSWAKIRKLSFKRKRFLIKLHPEGYGYIKDTVEFYFEGRNECKNFWKKCIENHTFFRCTDAKKGMRQRPKFFSRGSSFRYSGRTQMQVSEFVRENYVKRPFQRSTSLRTTNSSPSGPVGASISAQPLLPVSTSFSCSSVAAMTEAPSPSLPPKKLSASEPTTPHVAPDISNALTNGSVMKLDTQKQGTVTGLTTPDDYDCDPEGLQSPDCLGQDTDDNISHDSYQVTDKEESKVQNSKNGIDTVVHYKTNDIDLAPSELVNEMADSQDVPQSLQLKTNNGNVKYEKCDILENNNNLVIKPCFSDSGDAPELMKQKIALSHENMKSIETRDQNISQVGSHSDTVTYANIETAVKTDTGQINSRLQSHCDLGRSGNESKSQSLNSVLNGDSSVYSERSEDSDNNCLEENSGSFIDTLQSLGVPSFCIDSFGTLAESRILNYNKKIPNDRAYFIAKELLMTERTYRRDLEIVDVVFREEFRKQGSMPSEAVEAMLSIVDPLYEVHCSFLRELEQRMAFWEGRPVKADQNEVKGIGDIFLHHIRMSKLYETYAEQLPHVLKQLSAALESSQRFAVFYQQFETHKMCYLPLTSFLLRPLYRLTHYCYVLKDVTDRYENIHFDYESCKDTLTELQETFANFENKIPSVINYVKLVELERNLTGFPNLIQSDRLFIREGCLQKLSKNGNHQRMFFLFSDILLYTTRIMTEKLHFRVYGCLALADLKVQEAEPRQGSSFCFTIFKDDKCLLLAASSEKERNKWLKDLKDAIQVAKIKGFISTYSSQFSLDNKSESGDGGSSLDIRNEDKPISHHVNTSVHVCWHRNISVSRYDLLVSVQHSLSGFLLRKFKNNNGWQKLWVVLSSLCLFFYKSYLDDSPLASLPLAGYRVLTPSPEDPITKDHVFKLQYKNHAYFFRAESEHIFDRWMAVIHYATLADEEKTYL